MSEWSPARVVSTLLADASRVRDKLWIARYFASRQAIVGRHPLHWVAPNPRVLHWRSTQSELAVSVDSGALSAWYEVAHVHAYAALRTFVPEPGWTVVDVGASIGAFSTWAASRMGSRGRIIAIEPNPLSFELLQRSVRGVNVPTQVLEFAAGDTDGEMTLHFRAGYTGTSSLYDFDAATEEVPVRVRRIDQVALEQKVSHIDLMKVDVEGAEAVALKGADGILPMTDRVVLETAADATGREVRAILDTHGFRLVHARSGVWGEDGLEILSFQRDAFGPSRG